MDNIEKRKELLKSLSKDATTVTIPIKDLGISEFLRRHKENKERFKKEIQFKVK